MLKYFSSSNFQSDKAELFSDEETDHTILSPVMRTDSGQEIWFYLYMLHYIMSEESLPSEYMRFFGVHVTCTMFIFLTFT